jgi:hypothetical protein
MKRVKRNLACLLILLFGSVAPFVRGQSAGATTVSGTCGTSYVTAVAAGWSEWEFRTGFDINVNATNYGWSGQAIENSGQVALNYNSSGGLAFRKSWDGKKKWELESQGWGLVNVSTGSFAYSWSDSPNGTWCFSGGPVEWKWFYF